MHMPCRSRCTPENRRPGRSLPVVAAAAVLLVAGAAAAAPKDVDMKAVIGDLVTANHILYHQGVLDGFGHVSVRDPRDKNRFLMSRALAPGLVSAKDIMEFELDGKPIDQRGRPVYSERFIHGEIYKARPDVNAVVHSHSPTVIPFSVTQTPLQPITHSSYFLYKGVPVFEIRKYGGATNMLVSNNALGKGLADTLGDSVVVLLRGHGNAIVGRDVGMAVSRAIYTEVNARQQLQAIQLGGPITYVSREEGEKMDEGRRVFQPGHGEDRTWGMWKAEAENGGPARSR
jgi:ribulose-5-phosphate 4-epimerase/fuculose-1-phosphate aldolase